MKNSEEFNFLRYDTWKLSPRHSISKRNIKFRSLLFWDNTRWPPPVLGLNRTYLTSSWVAELAAISIWPIRMLCCIAKWRSRWQITWSQCQSRSRSRKNIEGNCRWYRLQWICHLRKKNGQIRRTFQEILRSNQAIKTKTIR